MDDKILVSALVSASFFSIKTKVKDGFLSDMHTYVVKIEQSLCTGRFCSHPRDLGEEETQKRGRIKMYKA